MSRVRVAVLISGRGSNLQSLIDAARAPDYPAQIALVVSNKEDAGGLRVAHDAGVPIKVIPHKDYASREEFDAAIDAALRAAKIDSWVTWRSGRVSPLSASPRACWRMRRSTEASG